MIPRRVSSDPESFRFVWEKSGVPLSVDVRLETPNRLRGRWTFVHPQYQYEGKAVAHKLLSVTHWTPFEGINKIQTADGLIDLAGYLAEKATTLGQREFIEFWDYEAEPDFFILFDRLIYGNKTVDRAHKKQLQEQIYQALTSGDVAANASRFSKMHREVHRDLVEALQGLDIISAIITLPPLKGLNSDVENLGGGLFSLVRLEDWAGVSPQQAPYFVAQQILRGPLYTRLPQLKNLALELYEKGLQTYLSSLLGYSDSPSDYLFLSENEIEQVERQSEKLKEEIRRSLIGFDPGLRTRLFSTPPRPGRWIAYQMVKQISKDLSPQELLDLGRKELLVKEVAYLSPPDPTPSPDPERSATN